MDHLTAIQTTRAARATRAVALASAALAASTLAACGSDTSSGRDDTNRDAAPKTKASTSAPASTPAPRPYLLVSVPDEERTVYRDDVTISGRVYAKEGGNTKGVKVEVDGRAAPIKDGRWSKTVKLRRGENEFRVVATKGGYGDDYADATITRKRSKAELAAAAAARQARVAARKQAYMASATMLPYNQLEKNPDRHSGKRVKFTGRIFQIQEDYGSSVILLSVTDEGYGFWSDNIWVDYPGTIKGAEDDIITVYGTIEGEKSYDTQIGGETYVPQMTAKYVVE